MLTLSTNDFHRLVNFIRQNYGIDLTKKRQLIVGRLSNTIRSMGYQSFTDYIDYILTKKNPEDIEIMLNHLTTNYTFFMREEDHFQYFSQTVLPYLEKTKKNHSLSIWSAGCSTGQEPYTLSILLKEYFGSKASQWDTRILATDISQNVLTAAQNAVYDKESLKKLPATWIQKYFVPTSDPNTMKVAPILRNNVIFKTFNLMDPINFRSKFDVIFCRNVMIYFDYETKHQLVNRFYNASNPGAYLFIGHSEAIDRTKTHYEYLKPALYRKPLHNKK